MIGEKMTDELACVYRYFLFGYNFDFKQDIKEFGAMQNRLGNRTLSSIHNILLHIKGRKYRQIGAENKANAIHNQAFEIVRFMVKCS